jgi:hypothetical protein
MARTSVATPSAQTERTGKSSRAHYKRPFRDQLFVDTAANGAMFVACLLARHFSRSTPNIDVMCDRFGMSRATAYRWRRAWLDAAGADAEPVKRGES